MARRGRPSKEVANKKVRVPVADSFSNRSGVLTKDARLYNCFPEKYKNPITEQTELSLSMRPGLSALRSYTAGAARGCFRWNSADYVAIAGVVYKDGASHQAIAGTSGHVGFAILDDEGTQKLVFADGTNIYLTDGTTVTQVPVTLSNWVADTVMAVGNRRIPNVENGFYYEVTAIASDFKTHATTEPVWPTIVNFEITDDAVTWKCAGYYTLVLDAHATTTAYTLGQRVQPATANGYMYECIVAGTSAGSAPVWPLVVGNTVVDGTVTWQNISEFTAGSPMPQDHLPYPVVLNNILYMIAKDSSGAATSLVYNSGISNPSSWNQVDYRDSNMYPDKLQCLVRHHAFVAAFGIDSLEFLYDAANATGSPLNNNDGLSFKIGTPAPETVIQSERNILFVGQSSDGSPSVWEIVNYTPTKVSTEYEDRILEGEGTNIVNARAFFVRSAGHHFYVIRLTSRCLVYSQGEKCWTEWTSNSGGSHAVFTGAYAFDYGDGTSMVLGSADGELYKLSPATTQDSGVAILMDIYTRKMSFETTNRKTCNSISVDADEVSGGTLSVRWSYDDYTTWSTARDIALDTLPFRLRNTGTFRTIIFNYTYSTNAPFRIRAVELDISEALT